MCTNLMPIYFHALIGWVIVQNVILFVYSDWLAEQLAVIINCASVLTDWSVHTNNNYCYENTKIMAFHYVCSSRLTYVPCAWLYRKYSAKITINEEIFWTSIWLPPQLLCPDIQEANFYLMHPFFGLSLLTRSTRDVQTRSTKVYKTVTIIKLANCAIIKLANCACASGWKRAGSQVNCSRSAIFVFNKLLDYYYTLFVTHFLYYCNKHTCSGQLQ